MSSPLRFLKVGEHVHESPAVVRGTGVVRVDSSGHGGTSLIAGLADVIGTNEGHADVHAAFLLAFPFAAQSFGEFAGHDMRFVRFHDLGESSEWNGCFWVNRGPPQRELQVANGFQVIVQASRR